jgi:hypothetical protein
MKARDMLESFGGTSIPRIMFAELDEATQKELCNLAFEPTCMLERGDVEGAVHAIKALELEGDLMVAFWSLFDSKQRAAMKKVWSNS